MSVSNIPPLAILMEVFRDMPSLLILTALLIYGTAYLHSYINEKSYMKKYINNTISSEWSSYFFKKNINCSGFVYSLFVNIEIIVLFIIGYNILTIFSLQHAPAKEIYPIIKEILLIFTLLAFFTGYALYLSVKSNKLSSQKLFSLIHKNFIKILIIVAQSFYMVITFSCMGFMTHYFPSFGDIWIYIGAYLLVTIGSIVTNAVISIPYPRYIKWKLKDDSYQTGIIISDNRKELWVKSVDTNDIILIPKNDLLYIAQVSQN